MKSERLGANRGVAWKLVLGAGSIVGLSFFGARLDHALADRAATAPPLTYTGTALLGGVPIEDREHTIGATLHTRPTGVVGAVCSQGPEPITTTSGRFAITFTDAECGSAIQRGSELFVEVTIDGTPLPRTRIGAVPFAVEAENGVPPGTVMAFAGETPPLGWVECDGRALDGEDPQYAALERAIGTTWGTGDDGDPATDFNIPDLRGRFLRGLDDGTTGRDEDRDSRTASAPGGLSGAHVGTVETDMFANHSHPVSPALVATLGAPYAGYAGGGSPFAITSSPVGGSGGAETRPENAAVLYIIKL